MSHHVPFKDLPIDGEQIDANRTSTPALALVGLGALGVAICLWFLFWGPEVQKASMAYAWLLAVFFVFTIACGGIFWTMLHHATSSGWGVAVRRIMESVGNMIPWVALLALPLLVTDVREQLWSWMSIERAAMEAAAAPEALKAAESEHAKAITSAQEFLASSDKAGMESDVARAQKHLEELQAAPPTVDSIFHEKLTHADPLLAGKYAYLNTRWYGFVGRFVAYFVLLAFIIKMLRGLSIKQDRVGGLDLTYKMRARACLCLLPFALCITFAAIDWIKGLNHHWFSTMWGVYVFAGAAFASMATIILVTTWLRSMGYLKDVVSEEHFHVKGKLLFAFTVFWAYISFSQYFLIWYANIPEETQWFLVRNTEHYNTLNIALVFLHFVIPFVFLLPAWVKRTPRYLAGLAGYALLVHFLDLYLLVIPQRGPAVLGDTWYVPGAIALDLLAITSVCALLAGIYMLSLRRHSLYPCRDPRLLESMHLQN